MEEQKFRIRTYGFGELAQLYLPTITPSSASTRLRAWIVLNQELLSKLEKYGFKKRSRILTPIQVRLIIEYLGEPESSD